LFCSDKVFIALTQVVLFTLIPDQKGQTAFARLACL
jgi:hypothetical protein